MIYYKVHAKGANGALCVENGYKNLGTRLRLVGPEWGDVIDCRRCLQVLEQGRRADKVRVLKAHRARVDEAVGKATRMLDAHIKRLHGPRALTCSHSYEPDTCMTEMRCEYCGVDANVGGARAALRVADEELWP